MADELMLEIVTPEKMAFSGSVEEVTVPGSEGEFGVLRGHASLLSSVDVGELNFTKEGKKTYYAVSTGYAEVTSSKVTILVETAERSDVIDKDRARRAKEIAEAKLAKTSKEDPEYDVAKAAMVKATTRLNVAEKARP
jgi:F-type H+-transporting ATPase subunit epsilon